MSLYNQIHKFVDGKAQSVWPLNKNSNFDRIENLLFPEKMRRFLHISDTNPKCTAKSRLTGANSIPLPEVEVSISRNDMYWLNSNRENGRH
jgi:hypothetical protein